MYCLLECHASPFVCWYYVRLCYRLTYLLTPWCRVLLEKLTGLQLVKKFPAFHRTWRFITTLTSVRHLSLSWASPIQSIYPHPTSWRSILILSTHQRLGLTSGLLPFGFPTKTLYTPSPHPYMPHICYRHIAYLPTAILWLVASAGNWYFFFFFFFFSSEFNPCHVKSTRYWWCYGSAC